jgi:Ca2+-binding RTX toxin-like protein
LNGGDGNDVLTGGDGADTLDGDRRRHADRCQGITRCSAATAATRTVE